MISLLKVKLIARHLKVMGVWWPLLLFWQSFWLWQRVLPLSFILRIGEHSKMLFKLEEGMKW